MEVDFGARDSIVTDRFFKSFFPNCELDSFTIKLKFFDGTLTSVGKSRAKVEFNDRIVECDFIVIRCSYPLCGRNLLKKLRITWVQSKKI